MARKPKPLEDQLATAEQELKKARDTVIQCENRIKDIKQQIDNRNMHEEHDLLKRHNISIDELKQILEQATEEAKRQSKDNPTVKSPRKVKEVV